MKRRREGAGIHTESLQHGGDKPAGKGNDVPLRAGAPLTTITDAPINILIVDDEPKNLTVLETVLDAPGYRLVRAETTDQALLALVSEEFALLILDIRMPEMTGFELAQIIKGRKKTSAVPIILLTAYYNEDEHVLEGYGSGAVDYLHKPVNATVLRSKVAVFAELHRKSREVEFANRALLAEVTERRRAEEQLRLFNDNLDRLVIQRTQALETAQAELREADRRKDAFIATLAHELRNPLAPVRYAAQILQLQAGADPKLQRASETIARQVSVMARLIDDLMDVSRINRGHIVLRREPVALARILELAVETCRPSVIEHGHELSVALPERQILLDADVTRLSQVFVNLLTNAAKYTDRGGHIQVSAQLEEATVRIEVRDDGIGIPSEQLHNVFAMFAQMEGTLTRARGGLGIGLSLVKHLVELHAGQIVAHSDGPGTGSTFVVTLPVAAGENGNQTTGESASVAATAAPMPFRPRKILVVEDHRDGAETITDLLTRLGHQVRMVHDGAAAILAADEFRPDLILLDIGLPTLSGYDVCRQIREQSWSAGTTIVAMTGWGDRESQRKVRAAGFDRHLVKPLDETSLMSALALGSGS